jgi:hypothetical protein
MSSIMKGLVTEKKKKPKPTSPEKWARAKAKARSKFDVYPSAYANAYASKEYKKMGGGWRMGEDIEEGADRGHGSPYDRGAADSWYSRSFNPQQYDNPQDQAEYEAGYLENEKDSGMRKDYNEGISEMDSQGYRGHRGDEDPGKGPEKVVKPAKTKDVAKDATKVLNKAMDKSHKKSMAEAQGDTLLDPESALQQARKITKAIKYENTSNDIIVQMQMLAERTEGVDMRTLEDSVDEVYAAQRQLESAVYGLEEAFEEAIRNQRYRDDDEDLDEDETMMYAAEKTAATNPYGGMKDRKFRGGISETEAVNRNDGDGWRWYEPREKQLDELKCWPGYTRVKGVPAGAPGSCKKKTKESSIMKGLKK